MVYGRRPPHGFLPVMAVGSEKEAEKLLTMACELNLNNEYVAKELGHEQTLENLALFSERLEEMHDRYLAGSDWCDCM